MDLAVRIDTRSRIGDEGGPVGRSRRSASGGRMHVNLLGNRAVVGGGGVGGGGGGVEVVVEV